MFKYGELVEYIAGRMKASSSLRDLITGERAIQAFLNVYLGLSDLYLVYSEKELEKGYADLVLEPFLAQYPQLKYSYLLEIKYIQSRAKKNDLTPGKIKTIKAEAEAQLNRYRRDEKFQKAIGQTTLKEKSGVDLQWNPVGLSWGGAFCLIARKPQISFKIHLT